MRLCETQYCIGCGVCEQKCPVQAIRMVEDEKGFVKPVVNEEKCAECNACEEVCPVLSNNTRIQQSLEIYYAVKASRNIREISASGGALYVLGEQIFTAFDGVVCVADRNRDFRHVLTRDISELKQMLEYEYIQSRPGEAFVAVETLLMKGESILFFGTPCQAAALKSFLGKDYATLYIVDNICEGVTSKKFLNYYLQEYFPDMAIKTISFRNKDVYRWSTSITIEFENGTVFRETADRNPFLKALDCGVCSCDACGSNCHFNCKHRYSDITIGDFWSVGEYDEYRGTKLFDSLGVSLISINSEKGRELFRQCQHKFTDVVEVDKEAAAYRSYLFLPKLHNSLKAKKTFLRTLKHFGFKKAFEASVEKQHDVALLGLWNGGNYGAIISANALYETIQGLGYETVFIDTEFSYGKRDNNLLEYITSRCNISKKYKSAAECYELNKFFSCFVVGSDQCWNSNLNTLYNDIFLLEFVADSKKKVSYSTSFGPSKFENLQEREKFKYFLDRFDAISVRENSGMEICEKLFGAEAEWVLDPILLRDKAAYEVETTNIKIESGEFVLNYLLDIKPSTMSIVDEINRGLECTGTVRILGVDATNPWDQEITDEVHNPSVYEFVSYFLRCNYVVTDSYHGVCLAILFNKPFSAIINEGRGRDRFDSLLSKLGLQNRAVEYGISLPPDASTPISWNKVNEKLDKFRRVSLEWLKTSLMKKKKNSITSDDFLRNKIYEQNNCILDMMAEINAFKCRIFNPYTEQIIQLFQEQIRDRAVVVIRGGGIHTQKLLEIIIPILDKRCVQLIIMDKDPGEFCVGLRHYQVIAPSDEIIRSADIVIISTWRYRREILNEIEDICAMMKKSPTIIELYKALNMDASQPFYVDKEWREY